MSADLFLPFLMRWIHIISATLAIGVPFFVLFVLSPAAKKVLSDEQHQRLRDTINSRWKHVVYLFITLLIITGLYTFLVPVRVNGVLVTARWKEFSPADKSLYHMLFGIKMIGAFGIFFLASALAGRTKTFAPIRHRRNIFLGILLVLAAIVVACAGMMHYLPQSPSPAADFMPNVSAR